RSVLPSLHKYSPDHSTLAIARRSRYRRCCAPHPSTGESVLGGAGRPGTNSGEKEDFCGDTKEAGTPAPPVTHSPPGPGPPYEFTEEQNKTIAGVSWGFRILGLILAIYVFKTAVRFISGIYHLSTGTGQHVTGERVFEYGVLLVFLTPLAVWTYMCSFSFQSI